MQGSFFPAKRKVRPEISMVPMINVVFLLLIFFLVTGTAVTEQRTHVVLPVAVAGAVQPSGDITIVLAENGSLRVNGAVTHFQALHGWVTRHLADHPSPSVTLQAAAELNASLLMAVMRSLAEAGISQMTIATLSGEKKKDG